MRHCDAIRLGLAGMLATVVLSACQDRAELPLAPAAEDAILGAQQSAPAGLVVVNTAAGAVQLWPYTGTNFTGTPQDPVNLIITGEADPRAIRAALLALDGNRTQFGFPAVFPFDCTWTDAVGGVQSAFDAQAGWLGSAIQLECGAYGPIRFHLRLFDAGAYTIGAAHFEILIPGTTNHQVLSWTLAQQFVTVDFIRTGLVDLPTGVAPGINAAGTFREIPAVIYNLLPPDLRAIAGGGAGDVASPVGIPTTGSASLVHVHTAAPVLPEDSRLSFVVPFNQVIPKPFCSTGPLDYVHVAGPVQIDQHVKVTPSGVYDSQVRVNAELTVTPMNVTVMPPAPSGPTAPATVKEFFQSLVNDNVALASVRREHAIFPLKAEGGGRLREVLMIGPAHSSRYVRDESCGS